MPSGKLKKTGYAGVIASQKGGDSNRSCQHDDPRKYRRDLHNGGKVVDQQNCYWRVRTVVDDRATPNRFQPIDARDQRCNPEECEETWDGEKKGEWPIVVDGKVPMQRCPGDPGTDSAQKYGKPWSEGLNPCQMRSGCRAQVDEGAPEDGASVEVG